MFLAQCPHCHTIFQTDFTVLGPYGGRVTCGECEQTFNAFDHPYSLDLPETKDGRTLTTFADDLAAYKPVSVVQNPLIETIQPADLQLNDGLATFLKNRSILDNIPVWEEDIPEEPFPTEPFNETVDNKTSPALETGSSDLSFLLLDPHTADEPGVPNQTEAASEILPVSLEPVIAETDVSADNEVSVIVPETVAADNEASAVPSEALAVADDENLLHQIPITADEPMPHAMTHTLSAYQTGDSFDDIENTVDSTVVAIAQQLTKETPGEKLPFTDSAQVAEPIFAQIQEEADTELDDFVSLLKDTQASIETMTPETLTQAIDPLAIDYPETIDMAMAEEIVDMDTAAEDNPSTETLLATPAVTEEISAEISEQNDAAHAVQEPAVTPSTPEPVLSATENSPQPASVATPVQQDAPADSLNAQPPAKKRRIWSTLLVIVLVLLLLGQLAYFFREYLPVDITLLWPMIQDRLPTNLPFAI